MAQLLSDYDHCNALPSKEVKSIDASRQLRYTGAREALVKRESQDETNGERNKRASRIWGKHRRRIRRKDQAQNNGSAVHSFDIKQVSAQTWRARPKMEKRQKPELAKSRRNGIAQKSNSMKIYLIILQHRIYKLLGALPGDPESPAASSGQWQTYH